MPFTSVPPGRPAPGWTMRSQGLSTTITSSSSATTSKATSGSGSGPGAGAGGAGTTRRLPARSTALRRRSGAPSTSTWPEATRSAAADRGIPVRKATARSSRNPAIAGGTVARSVPGPSCSAPLVGPAPQQGGEDDEHRPDRDRRVGDVEGGPVGERHEVHHRAAVTPEGPVGEVAQRAAEDQPEADRERHRPAPPRRHHQHGDDDGGERRDHGSGAGEQAEGGARVEGEPEAEGAEHVHRPVDPGHGERL